MKSRTITLAMFGALAAGITAAPDVYAQQTRPADTSTPSMTAPRANDTAGTERRDGASMIVQPSALEAGANSFTEGQVRERLEDAGFTAPQNLRKDDRGFWHGRATRGGTMTDVAMDFRGRIAAGAGVAALGAATPGTTTGTNTGTTTGTPGTTTPGSTTMGTTTGNRPDGTPGNPPSTMTGRAVDRAQGETPRPDGTPGNPAGTAAGRAIDRATGSNMTGTNPPGTNPTGTNPAAPTR